MVLKILKGFVVLLAFGVVAAAGFLASETAHLKAENEDLKASLNRAIALSEARNHVVNKCMESLTSCTRIVGVENPQIQAGLRNTQVKKESKHRCPFCDEVLHGSVK